MEQLMYTLVIEHRHHLRLGCISAHRLASGADANTLFGDSCWTWNPYEAWRRLCAVSRTVGI